MERLINKIIQGLALAIGSTFVFIALGANYIISATVLLVVAFSIRYLYGDVLKDAIDSGHITKEGIVIKLFKSPFFIIGGVAVLTVPIFRIMYS